MRRLIRDFVVCFLESIISKLATGEISIFQLVCVVEDSGLSLENRFCRDEAHISVPILICIYRAEIHE